MSTDLLFPEGEHLSPATSRVIMAVPDTAIPELLKIVRNRDLLPEISKSGGWAPIHAVVLLG